MEQKGKILTEGLFVAYFPNFLFLNTIAINLIKMLRSLETDQNWPN